MPTQQTTWLTITGALLLALLAGCNENEGAGREPGEAAFALTPREAAFNLWIHANQPPITLRLNGGEGPFTWTVSRANLGALSDTNQPYARTMVYTPVTGQRGLNRITATDRRQWEASAEIWQDTFSVTVQGAVTATPYAVSTAVSNAVINLTVAGGQTPLAWVVADTNLGTIAATTERMTYYVRNGIANGLNLITITDAMGLDITASILQYTEE